MYQIQHDSAAKIAEWMISRGGILVWQNLDMSANMGDTITPATDASGNPTSKPYWYCGNAKAISSIDEIEVFTKKEVARIPVAVKQRGSIRLKLVLTDGSARKLEKAKAKHPGSWHEYDYEEQSAVIYVENTLVPLKELLPS